MKKSSNPCIGKVQQQIRRFLRSLYQKPAHLSISPTFLWGKVKNVRGRFAPHTGVQPRRKSGVSSVLQRKTLAQAEFTSAEQVQSPKGGAPRRGAESKKRHDPWSCLFLVDQIGFEPTTPTMRM